MKSKILLIAAAILFLNGLLMQAQSSNKEKKILITYFSVPETDGVDASSGASRKVTDGKLQGNTEYVASIIQQETKGDLFEIKTVQQYPETHKELIDYAKEENESKARPKLLTKIKDLEKYDVVFIGFPNWWYDMPMPLYTFFDEYDFSGKTIVPFCTHGGSRFSQALKTIAELEKDAKILDGYSVSRDNLDVVKDEVIKWLQKIGIKE
ncbi:flavodoxin [Dysgonomonas sp. 521]|uniref:flavodoxin n=1 Tax=Dysgonomonas sp. 521 TaxID=2302932 RepID=UPI0013D8A6E9|nr:flavodoxin [Dysgonomonas sp. 521]NDV94499.1 flavodoxin [Dysgonomonas sp. 521]